MPFSPALASELCCPRCHGALTATPGTLVCAQCTGRYPLVGTIPCLMEDPTWWRALWLARCSELLSSTEGLIARWSEDARRPEARPRTRARIERVMAATEAQRATIAQLLAGLRDGGPQLVPTRPEPGDSPILECYENLFRDWAWGEHETEVTRVLVEDLAEGLVRRPVGTLAVYGAGAGRLAVEAHRVLGPRATFGFDTNPLPLLVAERLVRGETLDLPEFPIAPHSDEQAVVWQRLRCPVEVPDGFTFLFADALRPPFAPGSLDVVLTSWFIDVVRADLAETAASINRVLRVGGIWLNVGPLRFKNELAHQYGIEEVWDIVAASAFDIDRRQRTDVPYFDSPVSGSRRTETVFAFAARKTGAPGSASPSGSPAVAPWISDPSLPIPVTPSMQALGRKSMFTAGALSLVDGSRSMIEVAGEIGRATGVAPAALVDQLRAFFTMLPPG
jgi:uncharacterized protein YbaR (Trm112 family)